MRSTAIQYVGIDVHQATLVCVVKDESGQTTIESKAAARSCHGFVISVSRISDTRCDASQYCEESIESRTLLQIQDLEALLNELRAFKARLGE